MRLSQRFRNRSFWHIISYVLKQLSEINKDQIEQFLDKLTITEGS